MCLPWLRAGRRLPAVFRRAPADGTSPQPARPRTWHDPAPARLERPPPAECFALIDADGSGTLDARELRAVFRALGRPASLRQVRRAAAGARSREGGVVAGQGWAECGPPAAGVVPPSRGAPPGTTAAPASPVSLSAHCARSPQVQALVEQVAGPQAAHLNFAQFAMLMHSAASGGRPQDAGSASRQAGGGRGATPRHRARQGRGGAAGGAPAAAAAAEAGELSWDDFHLLAKAFRCGGVCGPAVESRSAWPERARAGCCLRRARARPPATLRQSPATLLAPTPRLRPLPHPLRRRAVVDGVIANEKGWREKVLALAERQAAASRASAASAAALWKHRAQRLQQRPATAAQGGAGGPADGGAGGGGAGAPAGPGAAAPRSQRGSRAGQEASELLDGAFSAGAVPLWVATCARHRCTTVPGGLRARES